MIRIPSSLMQHIVKMSLPKPLVSVRHTEYSMLMSADDDAGQPSEQLIDIALRSVNHARGVSMASVVDRLKHPPYYPNIWPGEHYKFLSGIVEELKPSVVIEIGTATGLSSLAMLQTLPKTSHLYTFDIIPWDQLPDTCLRVSDFRDGRLKQMVGDVAKPEVMRQHDELFHKAELIFIDGPKDGYFEQKLLDQMQTLKLHQKPILVFDDIRLWNMLAIWRRIQMPKLDMTSFGHWSGTGLVQWV